MPNLRELLPTRQKAVQIAAAIPLFGIACNNQNIRPPIDTSPHPAITEPIKTPTTLPLSCIPKIINPPEIRSHTQATTEELNDYERGLWQEFSNSPLFNETTECQTQKVNRTVGLMRLSTIKSIRTAGELMGELVDSNDLHLSYFLPSNDVRHQNALIVTKLDVADNPKTGDKKFVIKLQINFAYMKSLTKSYELASFLAHEFIHMQNFLIRTSQQERAGVSRQQILINEGTRADNRDNILEEEAQAYLHQTAAEKTLCEVFPSSRPSICQGDLMEAFKNYSTEEHWKDVVAHHLSSVSDFK